MTSHEVVVKIKFFPKDSLTIPFALILLGKIIGDILQAYLDPSRTSMLEFLL